ncbi:MAG: vitamin B12 dependent-methionine synthase activation domain-containing protein [bacterium]
MDAPFLGTKVLKSVGLDEVEALLDKEALFAARWQFRQGAAASAWEDLKSSKVLPIYERTMSLVRSQSAIAPAIVYGYFKCERIGNGLLVKGERRDFKFDFPRERETPNRCVADFFPGGFAAFQLVTIGGKVADIAASMFSKNKYSDVFYLKGLASEFTEASAEYCHRLIRQELGAAESTGKRFSPGYPAFPSLLDQRKIYELLGANRINVSITETCQLVPEHSTSAIVSIDEKAMLFRP